MTRDELKQYRAIAAEIKELDQEINKLRAEAERRKWPDGQPNNNYSPDRTGEIGASIADNCAELESLRLEQLRCRLKIERAIRRLQPMERRIMRLHYLSGLRWEEVAVRTGYSYRRTLAIHRKIIEKMP